eukprot:scaffold310677_cov14-Tisochrysis_lutea.AAC.1
METPPELLMRTVPKAHIAINLHQNRVTYNLKQAQISLAETSLMANPLCFSRFKVSKEGCRIRAKYVKQYLLEV